MLRIHCVVVYVCVTDDRHSASVTFSDTIDGNGHNTTSDHHEILTLEELKPFQHPEHALRDCQESLSNSDWYVVCVLCCVCVYVYMYTCVCVCLCAYTIHSYRMYINIITCLIGMLNVMDC